jgi:hypothetical protein
MREGDMKACWALIGIVVFVGCVICCVVIFTYDVASARQFKREGATCYDECNFIHNIWVGKKTTGLSQSYAQRGQCHRNCDMMEAIGSIARSLRGESSEPAVIIRKLKDIKSAGV